MKPGDMLLIPSLWMHNVSSVSSSVSVNWFWKHIQSPDFYEKKDLFGNKDPRQAEQALNMATEIKKLIRQLPEHYREFYAHRAIASISEALTQ